MPPSLDGNEEEGEREGGWLKVYLKITGLYLSPPGRSHWSLMEWMRLGLMAMWMGSVIVALVGNVLTIDAALASGGRGWLFVAAHSMYFLLRVRGVIMAVFLIYWEKYDPAES